MGKLAAELLRFDRDAEAAYAAIIANQDTILADARHEAMTRVQDAERSRGKDREDALREHEVTMRRRKVEIISEAQAAAQRLRTEASARQDAAAAAVLAAALREAAQ